MSVTASDRAAGPATPTGEPVDTAEPLAALRRLGLAGADESPRFRPLTGGVSSDIWRADLARGAVCVKRALPKLRVAADWHAPTERNVYEMAWLRRAAMVEPRAVPAILGHDAPSGLFVMEYLAPDDHRLWKAELLEGRADPVVAHAVADRLVRIHAATAGNPEIAAEFATDHIFHAIRLEPYLVACARTHPHLAPALDWLTLRTATTRRALVHGDVSPKNILVGPDGPVFLDAECAWYGDPAFDLAFCLNHLLLKCVWRPDAADAFLQSFRVMAETYVAGVTWEAPRGLEARVATLLPGLFLARVDGKSPVEYITADRDRSRVRRVARALLQSPVLTLAALREAWGEEIARWAPAA